VALSPDSSHGAIPQHDGVNDDAWRRLREVVSAANRGDADAHALAILKWPSDVPLVTQQRIGAYLLYLLWRQVKVTLGRMPTPEDLHELTDRVYPKFREILSRADKILLEETFRRVFEFRPLLEAPLRPGDFGVFSSVALGVLLTNPAAELEAMRPGLAAWLRRNQARFRAEGLPYDDADAERP
jgi:hypothetical protein